MNLGPNLTPANRVLIRFKATSLPDSSHFCVAFQLQDLVLPHRNCCSLLDILDQVYHDCMHALNHVTIKEMKEASREAKKLKKSYILSKLNEHQLVIYEILEKKMRMASGMLYKEYCKLVSKPVVTGAYRNYMKKMVDLGLVSTKGKGRWKTYEIKV